MLPLFCVVVKTYSVVKFIHDCVKLHLILQISTIGRCEYSKTCSLLISLFDQTAQSYQAMLQSAGNLTNDMSLQEGHKIVYSSHVLSYPSVF